MREATTKLEIAQRELQEAKETKELADDQIRSSGVFWKFLVTGKGC
ncbi:hypothetical protein Tco_0957022, partial [Tanacetum coccineum]